MEPILTADGSTQFISESAEPGSTRVGLPTKTNTNVPSIANNPMPIHTPETAVQLMRFFGGIPKT
jgi:hypothetical protein